jgi:delta-aminolevulinic acid dehydratase/porphobilinogen synthase
MDTSVWDTGADDISRVSAQEDTIVHTRYRAVQIEAAVYDDVQWHSWGFNSTADHGQCGTLPLEEYVEEDSTVDIGNVIHYPRDN